MVESITGYFLLRRGCDFVLVSRSSNCSLVIFWLVGCGSGGLVAVRLLYFALSHIKGLWRWIRVPHFIEIHKLILTASVEIPVFVARFTPSGLSAVRSVSSLLSVLVDIFLDRRLVRCLVGRSGVPFSKSLLNLFDHVLEFHEGAAQAS